MRRRNSWNSIFDTGPSKMCHSKTKWKHSLAFHQKKKKYDRLCRTDLWRSENRSEQRMLMLMLMITFITLINRAPMKKITVETFNHTPAIYFECWVDKHQLEHTTIWPTIWKNSIPFEYIVRAKQNPLWTLIISILHWLNGNKIENDKWQLIWQNQFVLRKTSSSPPSSYSFLQ